MGLCLVNDIPSKWDDTSCWDTINFKGKSDPPIARCHGGQQFFIYGSNIIVDSIDENSR